MADGHTWESYRTDPRHDQKAMLELRTSPEAIVSTSIPWPQRYWTNLNRARWEALNPDAPIEPRHEFSRLLLDTGQFLLDHLECTRLNIKGCIKHDRKTAADLVKSLADGVMNELLL